MLLACGELGLAAPPPPPLMPMTICLPLREAIEEAEVEGVVPRGVEADEEGEDAENLRPAESVGDTTSRRGGGKVVAATEVGEVEIAIVSDPCIILRASSSAAAAVAAVGEPVSLLVVSSESSVDCLENGAGVSSPMEVGVVTLVGLLFVLSALVVPLAGGPLAMFHVAGGASGSMPRRLMAVLRSALSSSARLRAASLSARAACNVAWRSSRVWRRRINAPAPPPPAETK